MPNRLTVLRVFVSALLSILLLRLASVQLATAVERDRALPTPSRNVQLPALRGRILDRARRPLIANRGRVVITVDNTVLRELDDTARAEVIARLAGVLKSEPAGLAARLVPCGSASSSSRCWNGPPTAPVPVRWDADPDTILRVAERPELFPGVAVELRPTRYPARPYGVNAAHVLGHLGVEGPGLAGRSGLERFYDRALAGRPGTRTVSADAHGRRVAVLGETPPKAGMDLVTSLDARLQSVVERELHSAVRRARSKVDAETGRTYAADSGAVVVMDVRTGRVLALASEPTYDLGLWSDGLSLNEHDALFGNEREDPLYFRAIQGTYAPGSIFKPVTTVAALRHGYAPSEVLPCPGTLSVGGRIFRNFGSAAYGPISFERALAVSCDTFFYRIGVELWRRGGAAAGAVVSAAADFGFGRRTGIDLPGESAGSLPRKPSRSGVAALVAIGQADLTVTPVQVAVAYAAIANGGTLWKPRLGRAVVTPDGEVVRRIRPERAGLLGLPGSQIDLLRRALRQTTRSGTAASAFAGFPLDRVPVASKTGTAEVAGRQPTSWFASFDDRYVVVMMVTQGGTGSATSGPSVRRIWEALYGLEGRT